jgi:hypothetical protein
VVNAEWLARRTEFDQSRLAPGEVRRSQRFAECVQVAQRARVGGEQAGLGVGDLVLRAVGLHQPLGVAQVGAGHAREQVVFDLVVQSAEHLVDEPVAAHICGM